MKYRNLGNTGVKISEVGIGTWEMSGDVWGKKDDQQSIQAMKIGLEHGANFIDTAAGYGSGHVETLVGRLLKQSSIDRSSIVISTKIKPECGQFAPPPEEPISRFYSPKYIRAQCEDSLRRLSTSYIDVLFLHTWSKSWGHETDWQQEMLRLKAEGLIRLIGISIPDEGIADANVHVAMRHVDVVQCVYNVFQQEPEHTLFPLAEKYGVGIIARSPFSSGAIVQQWKGDMTFPEGDWRSSWPLQVKPGWLADQVAMSEIAKPLLTRDGLSYSHGALKYVLRANGVSSVIPGSANPQHVVENLAASDLPPLSDAVVKELRVLWKKRTLHGTYNGSV